METNRLEIKGKENALEVLNILLESGYSVHMPFVEQAYVGKENEYHIIEYSFTKFGEVGFVLEEDD